MTKYLCIAFLLWFSSGFSQSKKSSSQSSLISIAREIIENSGPCTLVTLDAGGNPRARVMDAFLPDEDFNIWFGTNPKSRKVAEINSDGRISILYYDLGKGAYATVYGEAKIDSSAEAKKLFWKESWANFYPDYPNNYTLIKVIPQRIEIISESHGIKGDSITWKPAFIDFNN